MPITGSLQVTLENYQDNTIVGVLKTSGLVVYGVKADATTTFTYNSTTNTSSTTLNSLNMALSFSDSKKLFNVNASLAYFADCVPGQKVLILTPHFVSHIYTSIRDILH